MTNHQHSTAMTNALAKLNSPGVSFYDAAHSEGLHWRDVMDAWNLREAERVAKLKRVA